MKDRVEIDSREKKSAKKTRRDSFDFFRKRRGGRIHGARRANSAWHSTPIALAAHAAARHFLRVRAGAAGRSCRRAAMRNDSI
ncbi:hypothetical protein [Burkholderia humptydooensis]|uniref:hypothetical protein n=1 Tax=Burkholderia humptydooensis TaxID=430531 RepID=UPI0018E08C43|nr:hypothetical protein [Burkholderia humptydooensis]